MTPPALQFESCYVRLEDGELIVGNDRFARRWRIDAGGLLYPTSLRDRATDREWLAAAPSNVPSPTPAAPVPVEPRRVELTGSTSAARVTEEPSLVAVLTATGATATLTYRFQVFPGASGVTIQLTTSHKAASASAPLPSAGRADAAAPTGIEGADPAGARPVEKEETARDALEALALAPPHLRLIQVTFYDQTDRHNELVQETEWLLHTAEAPLTLAGNLFVVEDVLTRAGLIFLKAAPLPYARGVPAAHDFLVRPGERHVVFSGHGVDAADNGAGYAFVTVTYSGGAAGRTAALHAYQRQLRRYDPHRDGQFLSNTWGDRARDTRVNETFLMREIEAGARLGVDVVQIDDGWEKGRTSNSATPGGVWEGFYRAEVDFWRVHPDRFPHGLAPLIAAAREKGMRFGLWFAPDSTKDFANWKADADTLLRLHHEHGVDYFKIDGVKLRSRTGERNLRAFFDRVLEGSQGRVTFDNDVTAETRPGYWGLMDTGPLFVENRYTDWHRYWPHATLRNLWKLARYIDPVRLRMEWLNHARNAEKYPGDPLAPSAYSPDYLFATVLFSSPLGWFEVSNLPPSYFAQAAPLIAVWKAHRAEIFRGTILPIGDAPDGAAWTGFSSIAPNRKSGYLLVFREHNDASARVLEVPIAGGRVERLAGKGKAAWSAPGSLRVEIPARLNYVLLRLGEGASHAG